MTDESDATTKKPGRNGAFLGGIIGMFMWFGQPADLLDVSGILAWVAMAVFIGVCMVLGATIERLTASR